MKLQSIVSIPGSDVQYGIYLLFLQILVCYTGLSNIPTCWDSQRYVSYYTKTNKNNYDNFEHTVPRVSEPTHISDDGVVWGGCNGGIHDITDGPEEGWVVR